MKHSLNIVFPVLLAIPALAWGQAGVYSYQDCVLKATRDGQVRSREDIGRIKQDCQGRFPDSAPDVLGEKLSEDAMDQVDLYTNRSNSGDIRGSVYNGNPHVILTRVNVLLTPQRGESVQDFFDSEEFQITLNIPPRQSKHFTIEADKTSIDTVDFSSKLLRAWGY